MSAVYEGVAVLIQEMEIKRELTKRLEEYIRGNLQLAEI